MAIAKQDILDAIATDFGMERVNLEDVNFTPELINELDLKYVRKYRVIPVRSEPDGVWVTGLPELASIITVGQGYVSPGQRVEAVAVREDTALAADRANGLLK